MAVIINDFEVVPEPRKPANEPAETGRDEPAAPMEQSLTPRDIRDIILQQIERMARIRAC